MDQFRIDALTRFVARRTGRRSLAAGTLGGLLASLLPGLSATEAGRKKQKKATCKRPKRRCGKRCVNVRTNRQHCGKCNRRCNPGQTCRQGKCLPLPCGKGGPCRVFLTSSAYSSNLGGLAGADAICIRVAREAGLAGTYKAWLSNQFGSPASRFTKNPGPYVLTNGARIANDWSDLTDESLLVPINVMENGQPVVSNPYAWTGTNGSGTLYHGDICSGWTTSSAESHGLVGSVESSGFYWSNGALSRCTAPARLYCFQQS